MLSEVYGYFIGNSYNIINITLKSYFIILANYWFKNEIEYLIILLYQKLILSLYKNKKKVI